MSQLIASENERIKERALKEGTSYTLTQQIPSQNISRSSAISGDYYNNLIKNAEDIDSIVMSMHQLYGSTNTDESVSVNGSTVTLSSWLSNEISFLKEKLASGIQTVRANASGEDFYDIDSKLGNYRGFSKDSALSREMLSALLSISQDIKSLLIANKSANLRAVSKPSIQNFTR